MKAAGEASGTKKLTWRKENHIVLFAAVLSNCVGCSRREEREAMHAKIISKCNEAERMVFPQRVAEVANALTDDPKQDLLGRAYMELELGNHGTGRFFTPYSVCELMAEISTGTDV